VCVINYDESILLNQQEMPVLPLTKIDDKKKKKKHDKNNRISARRPKSKLYNVTLIVCVSVRVCAHANKRACSKQLALYWQMLVSPY
jgi:hypothetical protein